MNVIINLTANETSVGSLGSIVSQSYTEYDSQGRAYKQIAADGQISITEFDSRGRSIATLGMHVPVAEVGLLPVAGATHARLRAETVYDGLGRVYQSISNIIEYGTVATGVFTRTSPPDRSAQRITQQVYDEQGRVIETISLAGTPQATSVRQEHDTLGRISAEIDQLGNRKDLSYNASGQLAQVQLPAVPTVANPNVLARPTYQYEYNSFGQMSKLIDANNNVTNFAFSSTGQPTGRTLPSNQSESMFYDVKQRMNLSISFEGVRKKSIYDDTPQGGGRLIGYDLFSPDTTQLEFDTFNSTGSLPANRAWERIRMSYDAFGREITTIHTYAKGALSGNPIPNQYSSDVWTKAYDAEGRLTQETSPTGVIGYEYDPLGRKSRTWAGAVGSTALTALSDITYSYDSLSRLSTVNAVKRDGASIPTELTTHHYDLLGRMDYTEMPNEVVEDYTFDNMDDSMSCGTLNPTPPMATWPTTL